MGTLWWSLLGVLMIASLHFVAEWLRGGSTEQPRMFSAIGGLSLSYVVVHLLPELAYAQERWIAARPDRALTWLETQVYLAVLIGILLALAFDRAIARGAPPFGIRLTALALDGALLGGFASGLVGASQTLLAVVAFGSQVLINDHELTRTYPADYHRIGRWVLASACLVGWVGAVVWKPSPVAVAALVGLLAGTTILDVVKAQVHIVRSRRLGTFILGALIYAALVLAFEYSLYRP